MRVPALLRLPLGLIPGVAPGNRRDDLEQPVTDDQADSFTGVCRDERTVLWTRVPQVAGLGESDLRRALVEDLERYPGVLWARVNAPLSQVVVAVDRHGPDRTEVEQVVDCIVAKLPPAEPVDALPNLPGSVAPVVRAGGALAVEVAAAGLSVSGRLLRWTRVPTEVAALATLVDSQPRLRGLVVRSLGEQRAEDTLAVVTGLAQGLAHGTSGIAVDTMLRSLKLRETLGRRAAWQHFESELTDPAMVDAEPVLTERPRELPPGPVEQFADRAAVASLLVFGTGAASGRPMRALSLGLTAIPKAAAIGREAYAAHLGWLMARRGAVVMRPAALRLLDRVDTIVIDEEAFGPGTLTVQKITTLPGPLPADVSAETLELQAHALLAPERWDQITTDGPWQLGLIDQLPLRGRRGVRQAGEMSRSASAVLGLAYRHRLLAVVGVVRHPPPACEPLLAAAGRSGRHLITVDQRSSSVVAEVRRLQADKRIVLIVSNRSSLLGSADVGIGVSPSGQPPGWGADVLVGSDVVSAVLLVESVAAAAEVSRSSVSLSRAGSAIGALTAAAGVAPRNSARAMHAVSGAAGIAAVQGMLEASRVAQRPVVPPVSPVPWHALPADAVADRLQTDSRGLTSVEARRRFRLAAGAGAAIGQPSPTLTRTVLEELANPLTPILLGGAALSAAVGSSVDAAIVLGVSGLSALIGGVQRYGTARIVDGLISRSAMTARVWRDAELQTIPADQLVVGDVLELAQGDVVPADCRLIEADALEVDESSLTGEAAPVLKQTAAVSAPSIAEQSCLAFEGGTVAAGRGRGIVVEVGAATQAGRSLALSSGAHRVTGVEARLDQITRVTLPMTLGAAAGMVAAGLGHGRPLSETLSGSVGLAVAAVPEGLPFLVTAAQLAAARRLSRRGTLIRNPRTIEALGRADVLCFDKTGTLTEGRIRLSQVSDGRQACELRNSHLGDHFRAVIRTAVRAAPSRAEERLAPQLTDRAVRHGAKLVGIRQSGPGIDWQGRTAIPFESSRKYSATVGVLQRSDGEAQRLLCVKGAPEVVLPRCTRWRGAGAENSHESQPESTELGEGERALIDATLQSLTKDGLRVIAVAEKQVGQAPIQTDADVCDLTFLGFLALSDPVRSSARPSLDALRDAGVQIQMITGDHPATARAIGTELGLLPDDVEGGPRASRVITGADLDRLDDEALDKLLPTVAVVARGTPAHKVRVVQAFQRLGRTVAMTGDGANDAAAIKLADVGIALGQRGTPAARAAADVVVTDDRLETILDALIEGRAMWGSVKDALAILVGGNLGEIGFSAVGAGITGNSPLTARQMLLVNLFTDLAPAIAVALRPPPQGDIRRLLREGPETSLGTALTQGVAARGITTAAGAGVAWRAGRLTGRSVRARTIALCALVGTQLGQTLTLGPRSPLVIGSSLGSAAMLAAIVQTPGVSHFFGCTPLGPLGWSIVWSSAAGATTANLFLIPVAERMLSPKVTDWMTEQAKQWSGLVRTLDVTHRQPPQESGSTWSRHSTENVDLLRV